MSTEQVFNKFLDSYTRSTFFIGGQWVKPHSSNSIEIISPSTEKHIGRVPDADSTDINNAVSAAKSAFDQKDGWSSWSLKKRTEIMRKFAQILEAKHEELSVLYAHELGRPFASAFSRPSRPAELLRYSCNRSLQRNIGNGYV